MSLLKRLMLLTMCYQWFKEETKMSIYNYQSAIGALMANMSHKWLVSNVHKIIKTSYGG